MLGTVFYSFLKCFLGLFSFSMPTLKVAMYYPTASAVSSGNPYIVFYRMFVYSKDKHTCPQHNKKIFPETVVALVTLVLNSLFHLCYFLSVCSC
jgi:hypothetical protein